MSFQVRHKQLGLFQGTINDEVDLWYSSNRAVYMPLQLAYGIQTFRTRKDAKQWITDRCLQPGMFAYLPQRFMVERYDAALSRRVAQLGAELCVHGLLESTVVEL